MKIKIKPMKLKIKKINDSIYRRTIHDSDDNEIWSGGDQKYMLDGMLLIDANRINDLIEQMRKMPQWNIVEVENDFT
jgi:hypothetical protein